MSRRAKRAVLSGLDRALRLRGVEGPDVPQAREELLDWARLRARAARDRREIVGGLGVVVTRPGRAELQPLEVLGAGPGEVTVELLASAISAGTERAQWLRLPNARPRLPFTPGYSGAGRVLSSGVTGVCAGTRVAVLRARHVSVATVPAAWAVPVPDGVALEHAALGYLAVIAGYGVRRAGTLAGEPVCVIGAGPIGALAARLALLQEPAALAVVARGRRREAGALRAGATSFVTTAGDIDGIGAAAVIEATGDPDALITAVAAARPGGTVVLLGSPRGVSRAAPLPEIQRKRLRVVGAHISALATEAKRTATDPFAEIAGGFLDALAGGRLDVADLAGDALDPREIGLAYRRLGRDELRDAHLDWSRVPRPERVRAGRLAARPRIAALQAPPHVPAAGAPAALPALGAPPPLGLSAATDAAPPAHGAAARPLRFALLGCGDIGYTNARAIAAAAGARLAVAYDVAPPLAAAVAERFGGEVASTLEEALDPDRADAVFICTPHDLHVPLAEQAARAGLHVVVEKPLAADLAGAERIVAATTAAGVALSTCFSSRYYAACRLGRDLVRAGALGDLSGATIVFHADKPDAYWLGGFSGRAMSDWRSSKARAGGGVLIMNLTHFVDMLRHVAGAEPDWVAGAARSEAGVEVEDAVALTIGLRGGAIATLTGSAGTRGAPEGRFELWGAAGTLRLVPEPAIYTERALAGVPTGRWCRLAPDAEDDDRRAFVERFAGAVRAGEPPDVTAADALAVQAFVDAAYRAIRTGRPVTVAEPSPPTAVTDADAGLSSRHG